jgi:tight adherence protein C
MLDMLTRHTDLIVAVMAALSVSSAWVVVVWPYLGRDTLAARMHEIADEREAIRVRERAKLLAKKKQQFSLRAEPRKFIKQIFDRMNLAAQAEDGATALRLRMAGYRGRAPVVTFVTLRLIMPFAVAAIAAVYVFGVLNLGYPFFVNIGLVIAAAFVGNYAPTIYLSNKITKRQKAIRRAWPDALDLLLICVESGMSVENAFRKVSEEIAPQSRELAEELALTTAELSYLPDRGRGYRNLAERTGLDGVKAAVASLLQADKYGTSIGQSLRVLAQESRDIRMSEAEKKAAALPAKLTVPMILFFLPVLFGVILGPAIIQIMDLM